MIFEHNIDKNELDEIRSLIHPLQLDINLEGQKVNNGVITIGAFAGPESHISNIFHEFAHFIEIDDRRMTKPGWGLKYGKYVRNPFPSGYGPSGWNEFSTDQHIQREIRVWAYQANLHKQFNIKVDFEDIAESAPYLPDFWNYKKGKTDKERIINVAKDIENLAGELQYSFPNILEVMKRKKVKLFIRQKRQSKRTG